MNNKILFLSLTYKISKVKMDNLIIFLTIISFIRLIIYFIKNKHLNQGDSPLY